MADLREITNRVFDRMMAMYGTSAITSKWEGQDIERVKAVWAKELANYTPHQIGYALDSLKANNFPPSLPEFLGYCNQGAQVIPTPTKRIAHKPYDPNDPDVIEARERCMATMRSMTIGKPKPSRDWAQSAFNRHMTGEHKLTPEEMQVVKNCLALTA